MDFRKENMAAIVIEKYQLPFQISDKMISQIAEIRELIRSCVFHCEFEFIHPFFDGNGQIGRMWHPFLVSVMKKNDKEIRRCDE